MLELPEAVVIARQINQALVGKQVLSAVANSSPHKFAWYTGDPAHYNALLAGKTIRSAESYGGEVEIHAGNMQLCLTTTMRYHPKGENPPKKHQLLLEFDDSSHFSATVQMWGAMFCYEEGQSGGYIDSVMARQRPSPLSGEFDWAYFASLFDEGCSKLSAKEFLATKQRIPGLGNGVLQDILWAAKIHPRRKIAALSDEERTAMYQAVKNVLQEMTDLGGRDTERDLFGNPGGYRTVLSKNTAGNACPDCGHLICKEAFMGGSIYYCEGCQKV